MSATVLNDRVGRRHGFRLVCALSALALACSDSAGPAPGPSVHVVQYVTQSDTVLAWVGRLLVEVRDDAGNLRPGVTVRFGPVWGGPLVFAMADTAGQPIFPTLVTTDAAGQAAAYVRLGSQAGTGRLAVEVRSLGAADTLDFTIRPGRVASITVAPDDTAAYTNGTYTLRAHTLDSFGNARDDVVQLTAGSSGVTVQGSVVRATVTTGRELVVATFQGIKDTAWLSVVPRGVLAARNRKLTEPDYSHSFAIFELDGSNYRPVHRRTAPENFGGWDRYVGLHWAPSGDHLIFSDGDRADQIYRMSPDGIVQRLFAPPSGQSDSWPQYARDGGWLFFSRSTPSASRTHIYRARADGTEETRLSPDAAEFYQNDLWPSPAPNGERLVYATDRERPGGSPFAIWVQDVATGTVTRLNVGGESPRWSPTSEWIAFVQDYKVKVIRPDGSGLRTLSRADNAYIPVLDWSPDGRWVVAARFYTGPIDLIDLETGLTLPLAFTAGLMEPAWKPR